MLLYKLWGKIIVALVGVSVMHPPMVQLSQVHILWGPKCTKARSLPFHAPPLPGVNNRAALQKAMISLQCLLRALRGHGPFAKSLDVIHNVPLNVSPKSCCTSTKCGLEVMACTGGVFAPCAYQALLLQSVHPGRPDFPPPEMALSGEQTHWPQEVCKHLSFPGT